MIAFGFKEWVLVFSLMFLIIYGLRNLLETNDDRSYKRLQSMLEVTDAKKDKDFKEESLFKRLYTLLEKYVYAFVDKQRKKGNLSSLDLKIRQAGEIKTTNEIWTRSFIYGFVGSLIGLATKNPMFIFIFAGLGAYLPFYSLKGKIEKRQFLLLNQLPEFLDLVAITFPACSSLEETFSVVCEKFKNEISDEFRIVVNEINLGKSKRSVYNDLTLRTGIIEIATLVSQINQAEMFGTGLEDILVTQSRSIRHAKKVQAEKKGARAQLLMYAPGMILLVVAMAIICFPFVMPILESF